MVNDIFAEDAVTHQIEQHAIKAAVTPLATAHHLLSFTRLRVAGEVRGAISITPYFVRSGERQCSALGA
jgi:hypothetical protein